MRFINKIKEYILSFIEWIKGVLVYMRNEIESSKQAEYDYKKFLVEKTIDGGKFLVEKTIDGIKIPFKSKENMRIAGIMIMGIGSSFILASYIKWR